MDATIFHSRIIKNMKYYRKIRKMSQAELAHACAISPNYVGEIEMGRKFPSPDVMERIIIALGVEPEDLFSNIDGTASFVGYVGKLPEYADQLKDLINMYINEATKRYINSNKPDTEDV
jgi:transcriptional regulator with XRE-family HTH domain